MNPGVGFEQPAVRYRSPTPWYLERNNGAAQAPPAARSTCSESSVLGGSRYWRSHHRLVTRGPLYSQAGSTVTQVSLAFSSVFSSFVSRVLPMPAALLRLTHSTNSGRTHVGVGSYRWAHSLPGVWMRTPCFACFVRDSQLSGVLSAPGVIKRRVHNRCS